MLDKIDHPIIPDGYGVSVAFHGLLEMVNSVRVLVLGEGEEKGQGQDPGKGQLQACKTAVKPQEERKRTETVTGDILVCVCVGGGGGGGGGACVGGMLFEIKLKTITLLNCSFWLLCVHADVQVGMWMDFSAVHAVFGQFPA